MPGVITLIDRHVNGVLKAYCIQQASSLRNVFSLPGTGRNEPSAPVLVVNEPAVGYRLVAA